MKKHHPSFLYSVPLLLWASLMMLFLTGCASPAGKTGPVDKASGESIQIFLDEAIWTGSPSAEVPADDLVVNITHSGQLLISLPFSEEHLVTVRQPDGSENTLLMTGTMVRMMDANCSNHDCVGMGEITRENLDERILGGFIVCLPHDLIIEVRKP